MSSTLAGRLAGFLAGFGLGTVASTNVILDAIHADTGAQRAAIDRQAARVAALEKKAPAPAPAPVAAAPAPSE